MYNILNKLRLVSAHCSKCIALKSVQFPYRWKSSTVAIPEQSVVISNLCEKLKCSEVVAKNIYDGCPTLRSIDAIRNDSLQLLCTKLSLLSVVENPELMTIDVDTLERKIELLLTVKPKSLDDFASLLLINEKDLKNIICKRMLNEQHEVGKYRNRIYYMSEKLQVEPKIITQRLVECAYNFYTVRFPIIKKKMDIALDYGADRMDIVNCLYALCTYNDSFIRRSERMLSIALPIKMWYYSMSNERFDRLIEKHQDKYDKQKVVELTEKLKRRNSDKDSIIKELKILLDCDDTEASELYYNHVSEIYELEWAQTNVEYLLELSVSRNAIKRHGSLLTLPFDQIEKNAKFVMEMMPKQIDDFIPLICVETSTLETYKCTLEKTKDNSIGPDHPIYYFSERLNIPADEVAAHFVERHDVFFKYSPDSLKSKLNMLLKYDVDPASILRCKGTFRRSPQQIEKLVLKLKNGGVDKILSYMIADSYPERIIGDHNANKKSLEGFDNIVEYIVHRLNWTKDDIEQASNKHRDLLNRSPLKIKEHLDYLLNETRFNTEDIPKCLNIFSKNLDDLKARVDELSKLNAPITITALIKSKTEYLKYAKTFCNEENDEHKIMLLSIEKRLKSSKRKIPIYSKTINVRSSK